MWWPPTTFSRDEIVRGIRYVRLASRLRSRYAYNNVAFMSDESPADAYVSFTLKPDASIERVTMAPVSTAIDFSFDFQDLRLTPVPAGVHAATRP